MREVLERAKTAATEARKYGNTEPAVNSKCFSSVNEHFKGGALNSVITKATSGSDFQNVSIEELRTAINELLDKETNKARLYKMLGVISSIESAKSTEVIIRFREHEAP